MDAEQEKLLRQTYSLVEENHKILKKMQKKARWQSLLSSIKFLFFILFVAGAYYYLQPYLESIINLYANLQEIGAKIPNVGDATNNLNEIIKFISKK